MRFYALYHLDSGNRFVSKLLSKTGYPSACDACRLFTPQSNGIYNRNAFDREMTYPRQDAPNRMKAVPSKAERALKTKNDARFGASAVAMLNKKKSTAVNSVIYIIQHLYHYHYDPPRRSQAVRSEARDRGWSKEEQGAAQLTGRLPNTWLMGPHITGDMPMSAIYAALLTLMIEPVV